jgi:hypothetical protein
MCNAISQRLKCEKCACCANIFCKWFSQGHFGHFNGSQNHANIAHLMGNLMSFNLLFYSTKKLQRFSSYHIFNFTKKFSGPNGYFPLCRKYTKIHMICSARVTRTKIGGEVTVRFWSNLGCRLPDDEPRA